MKFKPSILIAFSLLYTLSLSAQPVTKNTFLPKVMPTSPEATGLGRFGIYQVNLFTGIPDISIPIYDIQVGELKVPISLSYNSSGIKVSDIASWAGLGWSLQTGGSINRKVMGGVPDENPNGYLFPTTSNRVRLTTEINTTTEDGINYLNNVYLKYYDTQPDIFSYSFPGHKGSFLFNQKATNFQPVLIPFEPVKINWSAPSAYNLSLGITDESGIDYKFDASEYTQSGSGNTLNATSTWMLTKMISSNKQDTIQFNFTQSSGFRTIDAYFSDYVTVSDQINNIICQTYNPDLGSFYWDYGTVLTVQQIITEIKFKNGKVTFEAGTDSRQDHNSVFNLQNRLRYIRVYSYDPVTATYNLLKTFELFHSYFMFNNDPATKRLRLDSIQVQSGTTVKQTYKFDYNNSILMPDHYSRMKDYWGYYNGRSNNVPNTIPPTPISVPKKQINYLQGSTATPIYIGGDNLQARDPDPNNNQACILQKITYPTGGYSQFEYETNQYLDDQNNPQYAGGLRIKSIKSYDNVSVTPLTKTYKYGTGESGYGRKNFFPGHSFFAQGQAYKFILHGGQGCNPYPYDVVAATKNMSVYFANPTIDMEPYDGCPVVYPTVTEYTGDGTTNTGRTIYQFNDHPDAATTSIFMNSPVFDSYHFVRGLVSNKSDYRRNTDGSYSIVKELRNTYQVNPFTSTTGGIGFALFKRTIYEDNMGEIEGSIPSVTPVVDETNSYQYNNYEIISSDNKLTSTTEINYDQYDPTKYVSTVTNYTYNDVTHLAVSQVQTTNSKGENLVTAYTYPYNYPNTSPYPAMDANHIWDKTITETKSNTNNGTQLTLQTNNYSSFGTPYPSYLPANIQLQVKLNTPETRASFNQYDTRGNILEMQKTSDIKQSFVWDYQTMYPVAEVTNASQSDIAYTSFEADGNGGWSGITVPGFPINGSVTGKKAYTQNNFSLSKTGLNTALTYIVSYWSKNGSYSVNFTGATALRTLNGWTLYQHTVANPSGGSITVSGSGTIDELRLYPSTALMKTYTYEPLIGISSVCDANNHLAYYYYDGFSRLVLVKDEYGNVLKKNCYNYYNQSGDCSLYGNISQSGTYTKACQSGYTGTQLTYTVPANTYFAATQADANTLASNDVAANGQLYANTYGTCTAPMVTITGSNSKSISYTVRFTKSSDNTVWYSFSLYVGANNATLGQIPQDTYNVQFQPNGNPPLANFNVGSLYMYNVTGATFNNVSITGSTLVRAF